MVPVHDRHHPYKQHQHQHQTRQAVDFPAGIPPKPGSSGTSRRHQAIAAIDGSSASAAHSLTYIFQALMQRTGTRGGDTSGVGGADHLHHIQRQQHHQLASQEPLELLDSCRRCAAFSASDFPLDAPDMDLAFTDPDWHLIFLRQQPRADESAVSQMSGTKQQQLIMTDVGRKAKATDAKLGGSSDGSLTASGSDGNNIHRAATAAAAAGDTAGDGDLRRQQCWGVGPFLGPIKGDSHLETYRQRVVRYIRSPQYRARAASIAASSSRGILISAGGPRYTTNLIVTLHVLRRHFGCTLPVEVAWQGPAEMDNTTWRSLERHFAPIRGFDVRAAPHPVPELHGNSFIATSYSGKVYALLQSEFREVLMIDADSLPLRNPGTLFDDPRFVQYGSLFWPDAWTGQAHPSVYDVYGIDYPKAERVLSMGLGFGRRDAESGQLLIDRARHLDVLEALLLINRRPDANRNMLWGDKDTFSLAFAAVGKAHCYNQVAVPPSIYFTWSPDKLLIKAMGTRGPGWLLGGFLQNIEDEPYVYGIPSASYSAPNKKAEAAVPPGPAAAVAGGGVNSGDSGNGSASASASAPPSWDLPAVPHTAAVRLVGGRRLPLPPPTSHKGKGQPPARIPVLGTQRSINATRLPYFSVGDHDPATSPLAASIPLAMRSLSSRPNVPLQLLRKTTAVTALADKEEAAVEAARASASVPAAFQAPAVALNYGSGSEILQNTQISQTNELVTLASAPPLLPPASAAAAAAGPSAATLSGLVSPVFLHRTINKLRMDEQPPVLQLLTAPVPQRWTSYFLAHENPGPTRGVPWDYCVPKWAIRMVTASAAGGIHWDGSSGSGRTPTTRTATATAAAAAASSLPPPSLSAAAAAAQGSKAAAKGNLPRPALGLRTWWSDERQRQSDAGRNVGVGVGGVGSGGGGVAGNSGSSHGAVQQLIQHLRFFTGLRASSVMGDVTGREEDESDAGGGGGGACPLSLRRHGQQRQDLPPPEPPPHGGSDISPICPLQDFYDYLQALDAGLPIDRYPALESACIAELRNYTATANDVRDRATAAALAAATASGSAAPKDALLKAFRAVQAAGLLAWVPLPRSPAAEFYPYIESRRAGVGSVAPLPVPGLMVDWHDPWPCADAPFVSAVRASYRAYIWLHGHQQQFPVVLPSRKAA
ncbi:hypothetical protein VaNZ11_008989 [Volvox africanus]|uniref:Uncharacterized protein n=1 Tax=Volvox africanus TaxID=51714 RepID=A0ABQ5S7E1_9CHLO|nr:hypothetical protein VaNZ11_008989 [Volvox africanus]